MDSERASHAHTQRDQALVGEHAHSPRLALLCARRTGRLLAGHVFRGHQAQAGQRLAVVVVVHRQPSIKQPNETINNATSRLLSRVQLDQPAGAAARRPRDERARLAHGHRTVRAHRSHLCVDSTACREPGAHTPPPTQVTASRRRCQRRTGHHNHYRQRVVRRKRAASAHTTTTHTRQGK